jgi:hypothetical protein
VLGGRVDVDDEFDVVNVDAAGGDVGRHEDAHVSAGELRRFRSRAFCERLP